MADLNLFAIQGRLTNDAEYSEFGQNNTSKLKFSIANNTGYKEYKHANYFNCEMIGKGAAGIAQYMLKGKAINISGEIKQERWETQDGNKSAVKLLVRNVSFISGEKRGPSQSNATDNPFAQRLADNAVSPEDYKRPDANGYKESNDDIPFGTF